MGGPPNKTAIHSKWIAALPSQALSLIVCIACYVRVLIRGLVDA